MCGKSQNYKQNNQHRKVLRNKGYFEFSTEIFPTTKTTKNNNIYLFIYTELEEEK